MYKKYFILMLIYSCSSEDGIKKDRQKEDSTVNQNISSEQKTSIKETQQKDPKINPYENNSNQNDLNNNNTQVKNEDAITAKPEMIMLREEIRDLIIPKGGLTGTLSSAILKDVKLFNYKTTLDLNNHHFSLFKTSVADSVPIYLCGDAELISFLTVNKECKDHIPTDGKSLIIKPNLLENKGILGYIYATNKVGATPIVRCQNPYVFGRAIANKLGVCPQGFTVEKTLGYYLSQN